MTAVPVVVKIGGSLLGSPRLDAVLRVIAAARGAAPVVVPGGGVFADAVRAAQAAARFGDRLAHRLALDAMGQMAEVIAARHAGFAVARSLAGIGKVQRSRRVPIWHPAELREGRPDIPESWDVTSDSLAAWLAAALAATRLVLVKSVDADSVAGPADLAAAGIVDAAFPAVAARFRGAIAVVGPSGDDRLAALLAGPPVFRQGDAA